MAYGTVHLALFREDQLDEAAEAIARLHDIGIGNEDISVISGVPISEHILGRPMSWSRVPIFAAAGAAAGFLIAFLLVFGTQYFYPIRVGTMPSTPVPTSIVVMFELTMLGLMLATFLGVVLEMITPSFGPKGYDARISDGHIGILFTSPNDLDNEVHSRLGELGGELVHRAEVKKLWP
jgi:hypothetical protein